MKKYFILGIIICLCGIYWYKSGKNEDTFEDSKKEFSLEKKEKQKISPKYTEMLKESKEEKKEEAPSFSSSSENIQESKIKEYEIEKKQKILEIFQNGVVGNYAVDIYEEDKIDEERDSVLVVFKNVETQEKTSSFRAKFNHQKNIIEETWDNQQVEYSEKKVFSPTGTL